MILLPQHNKTFSINFTDNETKWKQGNGLLVEIYVWKLS